MAVDPHDEKKMNLIEDPTEPAEPDQRDMDDAALAAVGLKKTTAYVRADGPKKKKGSSAERMARKRERDAAAGVVTKALDTTEQEALAIGQAVLQLKGLKRRLVMYWIRSL